MIKKGKCATCGKEGSTVNYKSINNGRDWQEIISCGEHSMIYYDEKEKKYKMRLTLCGQIEDVPIKYNGCPYNVLKN